MTYQILSNKKYGPVQILFTGANTVAVSGNSTNCPIATSDEVLTGAVVTRVWIQGPGGGANYMNLLRNTTLIGSFSGTNYMPYADHGAVISANNTANVTVTVVGAANTTLLVELKKIPAANGFPNYTS